MLLLNLSIRMVAKSGSDERKNKQFAEKRLKREDSGAKHEVKGKLSTKKRG